MLFRQAFSAAPTCSPSRASFMTGMHPHCAGMLGLQHRSFSLAQPKCHIASFLKQCGYRTVLSGVEHTSSNPAQVGYDLVLSNQDTNYPATADDPPAAPAAAKFLHDIGDQPFFLSVGLNETHRPFPSPEPSTFEHEDERYCTPPRPLPDTPQIRRDFAAFKASARHMDDAYGLVLDALSQAGLAENTLVCCFTDHGLQFPRNMCNLTDHGIGVYLVIRGPGGFSSRTVNAGLVVDELSSLIDLFPTVCDVCELPKPDWLQGVSLTPIVNERISVRDQIQAQINYHASYEPTRCVRTRRYKYIRRFDRRSALVLSNVDQSPSKTQLLNFGWNDQQRETEMLFDLAFDPDEVNNLTAPPAMAQTLTQMRQRLDQWMRDTHDPLCAGPVPAPRGARLNDPDQHSPKDPTTIIN